MATTMTPNTSSPIIVVGDKGGVTVVDPSTPLKRLNYYDGKFLRADDLDVEQDYLRHLVALSNQGLGAGVVYGFDTTLGSGDTIEIGPGLAVDPSGNVLLLQSSVKQNVQTLIEQSRTSATAASTSNGSSAGNASFSDCIQIAAPPPSTVVQVSDVYAIVICGAQALCGQSDVFGTLCEQACVTSTDRPYRLDGIVLRAIPLQLVTPFPTSSVVSIGGNSYLRSKVAHSWFADEVRKHPSAISRSGLLSDVWCLGSEYDSSCCEVPLAVVARAGSSTIFLDQWIIRRERIDAPARRYWQWKMLMRPWDVFLAQILQFQCQLADLLSDAPVPGTRNTDPCSSQQSALRDAHDLITQVRSGLASYRDVATAATVANRPALLSLSLTDVTDLQDRLKKLVDAGSAPAATNRILIRGGIIELPSAGYLPIVSRSDVTVNDQVRALLGDGLDLRFCITTADYVAHAVEEAQHMDRISLLQGLDDPTDKPHVDILVPDGKITTSATPGAGLYEAGLTFSAQETGGIVYRGAAREEDQASGGTLLSMAAAGLSQASITKFQTLAKAYANPKATAAAKTVTPDFDSNVFVVKPKTTGVKLDSMVANISSSARMFSAGSVNATTRRRVLNSESRLSTSSGTVDGLWLTASSDLKLESLSIDDHSAVNLRVVIGSRPASPIAVELSFNGTFTVTASAAGPMLSGTLNGIMAVGMLKEDPTDQQTTEYLLTERFNWPATISYAGDATTQSISLDVTMGANPVTGATAGGTHLRFVKTTGGPSAPVIYDLIFVGTDPNGAPTTQPLGRLHLVPDTDVVNASNAFHQYADSGLDIVQAALIVSEPNVKVQAENVLFPAQPLATKELTIEAIRDWVAFTSRRAKRCTVAETVAPPAPSRTYRVIGMTTSSPAEATKLIAMLSAKLHDPTTIVATIQSLLVELDRTGAVKLFVKFTGGSATAESSLAAAESDWKTFTPGDNILYAVVGAVGETDATLQLKRVGTFETAISAESTETATATEDTIIPFPQAAAPPGADGIMLFVTVKDVVTRHALVIYGGWDRPNHFLSPPAGAPTDVKPSPFATFDYENDAPQGNALAQFITSLTVNQPVLGVTLATTKAAPDAGAATRLKAVVNALVAAGRAAPVPTRQVSQSLNTHDRAELTRTKHNPDDFDEVIFLEQNAGA